MCTIDFEKYMRKREKEKMCMEVFYEVQNMREEGHNYTIAETKDVAEKILSSINYTGDESVPIVKIAKQMGFTVLQGKMSKDLSGFIVIGKNAEKKFGHHKIIATNIDDEIGHQRFVVAHELAHFLFDYEDNSRITYYDTYIKNSHKTSKEKIANKFAANLLMPATYFISKFDIKDDIQESVDSLQETFQVQDKAVIKRIFEVALNG